MTNKTLKEIDQGIRLKAFESLSRTFGFRRIAKPLAALFISSAVDPKEELPELGSPVEKEPSPK